MLGSAEGFTVATFIFFKAELDEKKKLNKENDIIKKSRVLNDIIS